MKKAPTPSRIISLRVKLLELRLLAQKAARNPANRDEMRSNLSHAEVADMLADVISYLDGQESGFETQLAYLTQAAKRRVK